MAAVYPSSSASSSTVYQHQSCGLCLPPCPRPTLLCLGCVPLPAGVHLHIFPRYKHTSTRAYMDARSDAVFCSLEDIAVLFIEGISGMRTSEQSIRSLLSLFRYTCHRTVMHVRACTHTYVCANTYTLVRQHPCTRPCKHASESLHIRKHMCVQTRKRTSMCTHKRLSACGHGVIEVSMACSEASLCTACMPSAKRAYASTCTQTRNSACARVRNCMHVRTCTCMLSGVQDVRGRIVLHAVLDVTWSSQARTYTYIHKPTCACTHLCTYTANMQCTHIPRANVSPTNNASVPWTCREEL